MIHKKKLFGKNTEERSDCHENVIRNANLYKILKCGNDKTFKNVIMTIFKQWIKEFEKITVEC